MPTIYLAFVQIAALSLHCLSRTTAFVPIPQGRMPRSRTPAYVSTAATMTSKRFIHVLQQSTEPQSSVPRATDDVESESPSPPLPPSRTKCLTGVTFRAGPLNQAVAQLLASHQSDDSEGHDTDSNDTISSHDMSRLLEQANSLIATGAVWARMEALDRDDILAQYDDSMGMASSSRALYADIDDSGGYWNGYRGDDEEEEDLDAYIERMQSLRYRRILSPSWIEAGTDLRVYPEPRRFPACQDFQDPSRILYQDTTFLVVDKPPMLPTQPDASNYYECCPGCVLQYVPEPLLDVHNHPVQRLHLCHRVDSCVGGCVVLSKDRNGQRVFQDWQRERRLRKVYLAVTTQPVPLGMHIHWMWSPQTSRGKAGGPPCQLVRLSPPESRRKARQFWNRCVLEVVKCEPIEAHVGEPRPEKAPQYYQSTIRLVTGRKHQVRAQLAALGCPIIRDTLYGPMAGITLDNLEVSEEMMDQAIAQCRVPTEPIGLQAHAILFGGIRAKAGTPWWRKEEL